MYMKHFAIYMKLIQYFKSTLLQVKKLMISWEFPGSPAVRTRCFHYKGTESTPDRGSEIQHAALDAQFRNKIFYSFKVFKNVLAGAR